MEGVDKKVDHISLDCNCQFIFMVVIMVHPTLCDYYSIHTYGIINLVRSFSCLPLYDGSTGLRRKIYKLPLSIRDTWKPLKKCACVCMRMGLNERNQFIMLNQLLWWFYRMISSSSSGMFILIDLLRISFVLDPVVWFFLCNYEDLFMHKF